MAVDAKLMQELIARRKRNLTGRKAWSAAYHFSAFGAAVLSALAAIILVPDSWSSWAKDPATVLAGASALLGTIAAVGGFERKWRANAKSTAELDALILDAESGNADDNKIRAGLQVVIRKHDEMLAKA
jgi:hypothetical protein